MKTSNFSLAIILGLGLPAMATAQEVDANCGIQAFPTGGCVTPSSGGTDAGGFQGYVGAQISFGNQTSLTPKFVIGLRDTEVSSDGTVTGIDLSVRFRAEEVLVLDSAMISALRGDDDLLGAIGVGYSYAHSGLLVGGSAEKDIVRAGIDYAPGVGAIEIYAEAVARTMADQGGTSCPSGFTPRDVDVEEPFSGGPDDFFVTNPALLVGSTTCEPDSYGFLGPGGGGLPQG